MSKEIVYEFVAKEGDIFLLNRATGTIDYKVIIDSDRTDLNNEIIDIKSVSKNENRTRRCFKNTINKDLLKTIYPEHYI
jgi:hypothetical protein